jgi:hypothetical protein
MRFATTQIRPLIAIGIGLAAVGVIALPDTPDPQLTAAAQTVAAPAEGTYWHTKTLWTMTHSRQFGRGANRYWVEEPRLEEQWTSPDGKTWFGSRPLGVRPKSAVDEKAWRRDGSPIILNRTAGGMVVSLSTKPAKGMVSPVKGETTFHLAGQKLSYEELQRMPAEPTGLKAWLGKAARVSKVADDHVDDYVTRSLIQLLHESPVPKEVRIAAYEALPTMPRVHPLGKTKDAQGRIGEGLSFSSKQRENSMQKGTIVDTTQVIVDTDAMLLLADSQKTTINGKTALDATSTMLQVGWTDDEPSVPALP